MERIKTNIVKLEKLYKRPCEKWLSRFKDGKIDAHDAFIKYGQEYEWLYENSPYDLIGWQIENNCFDWERFSWAVAEFCPEHFDKEKFNWKDCSMWVVEYCPEHFDPEKYNWENHSSAIAVHRPEYLIPEKYNWKKHSWFVVEYCPDKIVPELLNWDDVDVILQIIKTNPELLKLRPKKSTNSEVKQIEESDYDNLSERAKEEIKNYFPTVRFENKFDWELQLFSADDIADFAVKFHLKKIQEDFEVILDKLKIYIHK
ncbi:MAG: hypothetical protein LDL10_00940 [Calditerrivibrio sp.]|nr:hypothetical protein [Calditerrivibrio sp.]